MIDLATLQLITSSVSTLILLALVLLLIAGLLVTRRQYEDQGRRYEAELVRLTAAYRAEYDRMDREYARMVVAKDDATDRALTQSQEWRAIALAALQGLEVTGREATAAVGAVAAQRAGGGRG